MATTRITYAGNGVQKNFTFSFPYISTTHVKVFVNDLLLLYPSDYSVVGGTVYLTVAPGSGAAIEIIRQTSPTETLVDFTNGAVLGEAELDTAYLHNYYLSQEYSDGFSKLINDSFLSIASGVGITETDPDAVIAALVNEMLADAAASTLQTRVNDIDANAESILTLGTGLQVQINTLAQGVAANVYVQAAEPVPGVGGIPDPIAEGSRWYDSDDNNKPYIYQSLVWVSIEDPRIGQAAADITVLQTNVSDNAAAVVAEALARSTADSAFASTLALIGAETDAGAAFLLDLATVKVGASETLASRFSTLSTADSDNAAAITSEQTARISADSAIATDVTNLTSTVGDNTANITTNLASINGIKTEYGVTLDVNGFVSGFKLINNGVGSSAFVIAADKFAVANASNPSLVPFEIIGSKVRLRGDVEISGSLLLNGTVVGASLVAGTIGSTQIGANAITTTQLNASAVTAAKIAAGSISADKMNVTTLAAINANLGTITAGNMTLDSSGFIRGGATSFGDASNAGFWLGYDTSAYKFSIGDFGTGNYLKWDGTTLTIKGNLFVGTYGASDAVLLSADTERTATTFATLVELKRFTIDRAGSVRVKFRAKSGAQGVGVPEDFPSYVVKRNSTSVASGSLTSTSYSTKSHDVTGLVADDTVSIWGQAGLQENLVTVIAAYVDQADICADVVISATGGTVDVD